MTNDRAEQIAGEVFGADTDKDFLWYAIWNETGYPEFFNDTEPIEDQLRRQLEEFRDTRNRWLDRHALMIEYQKERQREYVE